jgi:hypothetical protein
MQIEIVRVYPVATHWVVSFRRGLLQKEFPDREMAETFARETAQKNSPALLEILGQDGVIQAAERFAKRPRSGGQRNWLASTD